MNNLTDAEIRRQVSIYMGTILAVALFSGVLLHTNFFEHYRFIADCSDAVYSVEYCERLWEMGTE